MIASERDMIALDRLRLVQGRHERVINEEACVNLDLLVDLGHNELYDGGHDGGSIAGFS